MRRFFENKIAFAAVAMLFALAFGWNLSHGVTAPWPNPLLVDPSSGARGQVLPVAPPSPAKTASGPTMPPPPWEEVQVASGPTMPPPPWEEVRVASGPTMPPPPWEEMRIAA
jgi:hypothetical protein